MPRKKIKPLDYSKAKEHVLVTKAGRIPYLLIPSSRRKSMEITVHDPQRVRVVVPAFVSSQTIESFIRERADWIVKRLHEAQQADAFMQSRDYATGHEFLFLGKKYPLYVEACGVARVKLIFDEDGWVVTVPQGLSAEDRAQKIKAALVKWYRQEALEILGARVFHFVRMMGLEPMTVAVKTQKRIWGCCHYHEKKIYLNWLLVLAPMDVVDYVIVHELAHLTHPNHSKRFWNKVAKYLPDHQLRSDWLKNHMMEMKLP